jgi:hypothetical protein
MVLSSVTPVGGDTPKETSPLLPTLDGPNTDHIVPGKGTSLRYKDEEAQSHLKENEARLDTQLRKQVMWISPALGIGIFLAALDQTIVACAYVAIGSDLKALNKTSWIATA